MATLQRPLWTCPECGKRFVTANMWHSCGQHTVEDFFAGRPASARELFDAYVRFVEQIGPFVVDPAKTRIAFQARVRFAGVRRITRTGLDVGFWLKRRIESPRFSKVEFFPPNNYVYGFRLDRPEDLDDEVRGWLAEAYRVGLQDPAVPAS